MSYNREGNLVLSNLIVLTRFFAILFMLLLTFLLILSATYATTVQVVNYSVQYDLTLPININIKITSATPINGSLTGVSAQAFINVDRKNILASDFSLVGSQYETNIPITLHALDTGNFIVDVQVFDNAQSPNLLATTSISSSIYYSAPPQVLGQKSKITPEGNVEITFETDIASTCKFDFKPTTYSTAPFTIYQTTSDNLYHTYVLANTKQKQYHFFLFCKAIQSGTITPSTYDYTYTVDNTPPVILSYSPLDAKSPSVDLSIITNEDAICKYGPDDVAYLSLPAFFEQTQDTNHQTRIEFGTNSRTIYVRCADQYSNIMTNGYKITYAQAQTKNTNIDIENYQTGDYLTDGLHHLTIQSSVPIAQMPDLTINYIRNHDIETIKIPLKKLSETSFEGSFIIQPNDFAGIAYFDFSATDIFGETLTSLSGESTLLVLASQPEVVENARAQANGDSINLAWIYKKDEYFSHFLIKKYDAINSLTAVGTYSTSDLQYYDTQVIPDRKYSYEIYAVNKAQMKSNAVLIEPIAATAKTPTQNAQSSQVKSNYDIPAYLQNNLLAAQQRILSLKTKLEQTNSNPILTNLGLAQTNKDTIQELENTLDKSQKAVFSSNQEVTDQISALLDLEKRTKSNYVVDAQILQTKTFTQDWTSSDIESALEQYLQLKRWDGDSKAFSSFLSTITSQNKKTTIDSTINSILVTYDSGIKKTFTYVKKTSSTPIDSNEGIYDFIPQDLSGYSYLSTNLQRTSSYLYSPENSISYYYDTEIILDKFETTKAFILPKTPFDTNTSTGNFFANFGEGTTLYYILGSLAILILGFYYYSPNTFSKISSIVKSEKLSAGTDIQIAMLAKANAEPENKNTSPIEQNPTENTSIKGPLKFQEILEEIEKDAKKKDFSFKKETLNKSNSPSSNNLKTKFSKKIELYDASYEKEFVTHEGKRIKNIAQLAAELLTMPEHIYFHHVNADRNDFAQWIKDVFSAKNLAKNIKKSHNKNATAQIIFDELKTNNIVTNQIHKN